MGVHPLFKGTEVTTAAIQADQRLFDVILYAFDQSSLLAQKASGGVSSS
jgi:hypothetical protein